MTCLDDLPVYLDDLPVLIPFCHIRTHKCTHTHRMCIKRLPKSCKRKRSVTKTRDEGGEGIGEGAPLAPLNAHSMTTATCLERTCNEARSATCRCVCAVLFNVSVCGCVCCSAGV